MAAGYFVHLEAIEFIHVLAIPVGRTFHFLKLDSPRKSPDFRYEFTKDQDAVDSFRVGELPNFFPRPLKFPGRGM